MKPTDILIWILAACCLLVSIIGQPWSELGFGQDPKEITTKSMLAEPLTKFAEATQGFSGYAKTLQSMIQNKSEEEATQNGAGKESVNVTWVQAGNYAYVWFMALAMVAGAIAIIMIGREDAEEKLVLPVKK